MPKSFYGLGMWKSRVQPVVGLVQNPTSNTQASFYTQHTVDKLPTFPMIRTQFLYSLIHSFFAQITSVRSLLSHSIHKTYNYIPQPEEKNFQVIRTGIL